MFEIFLESVVLYSKTNDLLHTDFKRVSSAEKGVKVIFSECKYICISRVCRHKHPFNSICNYIDEGFSAYSKILLSHIYDLSFLFSFILFFLSLKTQHFSICQTAEALISGTAIVYFLVKPKTRIALIGVWRVNYRPKRVINVGWTIWVEWASEMASLHNEVVRNKLTTLWSNSN